MSNMEEQHVISHTKMGIAVPDMPTLYRASFVIGVGLTLGIAFSVSVLVTIRKTLGLVLGV